MSQPEFVFNERTMGIMGQDAKGNRKYFEKASFSLTLLKHVDAGGQDSGFLCLVKCSITGEDRKCFFRTNKVLNGGVSKFIEELNQSCKSGVLMCEFDSSQFRMFLRDIMKSYFRNCENENRRKTFKAAKTIGRQEGSKVWVINESIHIDDNGDIVPEEEKEFVWIDDLFDDNVKTQEVIYPFTTQALNDVLRGLKETLHGNFIASFLAVVT
ncbi:uncharacterized protein [Porites lutea]|uniref:uncharacterized protein n=1 Tax=Porites lutea TaxID=51062 RepID=UPI003CC606EE